VSRVVHSLFKEYHTCARSFSLLPLPAPLSLSRPARKRLLKKLLSLLMLLQPMPLPLLPTLLPLLLKLLLLQPTLPLRQLTLLPLQPTLLAMLLPLLRMLPRRCNLRLTAKIGGRGGNLAPLFFCPVRPSRSRAVSLCTVALSQQCRRIGGLPFVWARKRLETETCSNRAPDFLRALRYQEIDDAIDHACCANGFTFGIGARHTCLGSGH
jgi:hypothetical protein